MNLQYFSKMKEEDRECGRLTFTFRNWACTWKSVGRKVCENSINIGRKSIRKTTTAWFFCISTKNERDGKISY